MDPFKYAMSQAPHASRNWKGLCLVFVRTCFGVAAKYPSAASAWSHAKYRHETSDPDAIPRGVPVFWTGGTRGYGHVALSRGNGSCWSTDIGAPGQVDVCRITTIAERWGLRLVGWTEDLNGVRVYDPAPERKPGPKKPAKPTRVQAARAQLAEALELLDASVRNGRVGTVKHVRDAIRADAGRLPKK